MTDWFGGRGARQMTDWFGDTVTRWHEISLLNLLQIIDGPRTSNVNHCLSLDTIGCP